MMGVQQAARLAGSVRASATLGQFVPKEKSEEDMSRRGFVKLLSSIGVMAVALPAWAADVTPERLLNSPKDGQNWLMVHRDYDNSRHSPLADINRDNAK